MSTVRYSITLPSRLNTGARSSQLYGNITCSEWADGSSCDIKLSRCSAGAKSRFLTRVNISSQTCLPQCFSCKQHTHTHTHTLIQCIAPGTARRYAPTDRSSTVAKIAAHLRADGSTVCTSRVASCDKAAGSQRAYSLDSWAMGQTDGHSDHAISKCPPRAEA